MGPTQSLTSKEIIFNCHIHDSPLNGICGDPDCNSGFICLKCNSESCTVTKSHELITINEFYNRYLLKSNKSIDYKKLAEFIDKTKRIETEQLKSQIEKYIFNAEQMIDVKLNGLSGYLSNRLDELKRNVASRLIKIQNDYIESERRIDLSNFEIPESFGLEETKKYFDKNFRSMKDLENMINLIKKYSDKEKLQMNQRDLETVLYTRNLPDLPIEDTIAEKLEAIIKEISDGLEELSDLFDIKKETAFNIFSFGYTKFTSDPIKLKQITEISDKAQKNYTIDSVVCAFTTFSGKNYVAWTSSQNSIMLYDLAKESIAHTFTGTSQQLCTRHFADEKTSTDYLLSTSCDKSCKIWNLNNNSLMLNIPNCHTGYYLYSALMVFDNENTYVVTSSPNEYTKVWDLKTGKYLREVGTNSDYTYFLNTWYDHENNNIYIINANSVDVKLYNFKTGALFKNYKPESNSTWHMSAFISEYKNAPHLFETDGNGNFRIWDVKSGIIVHLIQVPGCNLRGLCFWNDQYVIAAASDKTFKIFDLKNLSTQSSLKGHDDVMCAVDKAVHPVHGECLITSSIDGKIKLWTNKI
jgi:WD40 repeat protein